MDASHAYGEPVRWLLRKRAPSLRDSVTTQEVGFNLHVLPIVPASDLYINRRVVVG